MDEAHAILLSSLKSSGVSLPNHVASIKDFTSDALVSICAQSLRLILGSVSPSLPTSLPASTAGRYKLCTEFATAINSLGYREELGFRQFLYPSDAESLKLVRFLIEQLSEASECKRLGAIMSGEITLENSKCFRGQSIRNTSESESFGFNDKMNTSLEKTLKDLSEEKKNIFDKPEGELSLKQEYSSKLHDEIMDLKDKEKWLMDEVHAKTPYVQTLQDKHDILKSSLDLTVYCPQPIELYIQELEERNIAENSLIEKSMDPGLTYQFDQLQADKRLAQLKETEQEIEAIMTEMSKREAEHADLHVQLEQQPKLASRKSYIERITEITKNSRKLDSGIQQILKETRELQLESNSIQERLHRTHAVADETVFREAKKDASGKQAYMLLSSIHEGFQQIAATIQATDRVQREAAGLEAKLAGPSSAGFFITKLQADLDSITRENELLSEQNMHKSFSIS